MIPDVDHEVELFRALVSKYLADIRASRAVPNVLSEASLYPALDGLLNGALLLFGRTEVRAVQQARTRFGIPDWVIDAGAPIGYVEAKRPATDLDALAQRDAKQVAAYLDLPNLLLTNYREFRLFEDGKLVEQVRLGGPEIVDHRRPAEPSPGSVDDLRRLLERFFAHRIVPPRSVEELARSLARATRILREATRAALKEAPEGALATLLREWRQVLFHGASAEEFADAYAQTVTYGLLTARLDLEGRLTVGAALDALRGRHPFLGAALRLLTDPEALDEVGWAIDLVVETLDGVGRDVFRRARHVDDPSLYFYEDFLGEYDAAMRKRRGVYFTPASVVAFQVSAIADLLEELGRPKLLADDVIALDPAAGTGTYLLGLLDETVGRVRRADGDAAVPAAAERAAANLNGFEILVGPYTVAHQRLAARLSALGAGKAPVRVFLVDTLAAPDSPSSGQLRLPFERQLSQERMQADEVKRDQQVVVILGNPPYERSKGRPSDDWLQREMALFTGPVSHAARVNLKNLADAYIYFFRWALWKLFESRPPSGPRMLSFISNRSYLGGDAFEGLRLALRQRFDEIWVVDLEGERRGPMASENIFDQIQVGVAIVVATRRDAGREKGGEAVVRYTRIPGTREEKERALKHPLRELEWEVVERSGRDPFLPKESAAWIRWPSIADLMPVRCPGVETARDALVVGVTRERLAAQLERLVDPARPQEETRRLFHETRSHSAPARISIDPRRMRRYGYRPLDLRWLYDDPAFIDWPRPKLRRHWHEGQLAFVTLPKGHGPGPAVIVQTELPDRHAFRGSFGGHVFPLWLDEGHREPNLAPGFLRLLGSHLREAISAEDVFAYLLALTNAPSYHARFATDLAQGFPRVPFTTDLGVFHEVAELGRGLLDAYRFRAEGPARFSGTPGPILDAPGWAAGKLRVCPGGFIEPVSELAWDFSVSGYRVIENWLRKGRAGLDLASDWSLVEELLGVVRAVEGIVSLGPALDRALTRVLERGTLSARAVLPIDLRAAARAFAAHGEALRSAAEEADLWSDETDDALLGVEP